jgi:N-acetyl-anhydromuramyl-L-alanine amidase AmpD
VLANVSMLETNGTMRLPAGEFFAEKHPKSLIVLHHTVGGSAKSTFDYWKTDPQHIGTAFLIERDGTIYETFPPEHWAYHLGLKGALGDCDRRSIGIELASEGPLLLRGDTFYKFDRASESTIYRGKVYDHGAPWRGDRRYFAAYTEPQLFACFRVVKDLLDRFEIPRFMPANYVDDNPAYRVFKGVISHSHVRADKTDVHPGFDWEGLMQYAGLRPYEVA